MVDEKLLLIRDSFMPAFLALETLLRKKLSEAGVIGSNKSSYEQKFL